ncbi:MAG TPA: Gfo/Idh/MocA family oxidoreductase [Acidobacteriota bacterium]|nr:Gfo/Idh/MocA family oxidoreductase [Acidobacteriota bacterium]
MKKQQLTRRDFLRVGAGAAALGAAGHATLLVPNFLSAAPRSSAPSNRVRFASIGTGVRGCDIMRAALTCPDVEIVAACDLYDGRLIAAQEVAGKKLPTTKDYRAILDRKDVDAVVVAVPDHWHRKIVEDVCSAGKDAYCEKPMSHTVEDGFAMVAAMQKNGRIVQVGSQARSSIIYAKAHEIYTSGYLGQVTAIEAWIDRNDASGAWVYPIPPDANEQTVDWERFLGSAPKCPFDLKRFFRWRCFKDYGEGLPGDLFVHLLTGMFTITGINQPPIRAASMGGLLRWKDERDVADLIWTLFEYPDFRLGLRCNLNNESPAVERVCGTKGTLEIKNDILTVTPQETSPQPESYSILGWPEKLRKEYLADWRKDHPAPAPGRVPVAEDAQVFKAPASYDYTVDHFQNFFESVRTRKPSVEDAVFGNHTAIACHMANYSLDHKTMATWDASSKTIKG